MKRALLLAALAACRSVSTEGKVPEASTKPVAIAEPVVDAAVAPVEPPLAWGTRPPKEGPLFPVVDGMCMRGEVWPVGTSALFSMGRGTMGRFVDSGLDVSDDVTRSSDPKQAFERPDITRVTGTWPGPLLVYGRDRAGGRMRSYDSTWLHEANGWSLVGSYREKDEPSYAEPLLHHGWIITARTAPKGKSNDDAWTPHLVVAYPAEKNATPIPGIAQLARAKFFLHSFVATEGTIYAFGANEEGRQPRAIRALKDGKVSEIALPDEHPIVIGTTGNTVYFVAGEYNARRRLYRLDEGKLATVPLKLATGVTLQGGHVAPSGDVWLLTSKNVVMVLHGDEVTETALPAPATPRPKEKVVINATSGAPLVGVDVGDPYAIGEGGSVFHFASGTWQEVPLPAPPFATTGKYKAQSLYMPAKGDLYVNAAYVEKGEGWKGPLGYRAILRTKRPTEVLRCNEPLDEITGYSEGVMSFAPIADESCTTPIAVLVRLAFQGQEIFDRKSDHPTVRAAIKATPSLGTSVDLVEFTSGTQRYLGAKVPSVAAGKELARAAVGKVKSEFHTTHPEIVCGTPKEERVLHIDVATGNVTP